MADKNKSLEKLDKLLESILFVYGNPISINKLVTLTKNSKSDINSALKRLQERLENNSGLRLIQRKENLQLVASKNYSSVIEKLFKQKHKEELTRASLEVLAIVAYQGPVGRVEIETIRGVNSSYILRNLLMRGLINKAESKNPFSRYELSFDALRRLGLVNQEELPRWREIRQQVEKIKESMQES
jgi:segregation and condensation protein B